MTRPRPAVATAIAAAAILALAPGCATIVTGTRQKVRFLTDPPGATVTLDTGATVKTPGVLYVGRRLRHTATITAPGRCPAHLTILRHVQAWVLGDVATGILPGLIVDFLAGGAFGLPKTVRAQLPAPTNGRCASAPSPS